LPVWKNWLNRTLPYIQGPRVLEVSFGTGYLLTQFAGRYQAFGIDYNAAMAQTAKRNLQRRELTLINKPLPLVVVRSKGSTACLEGVITARTPMREGRNGGGIPVWK
jgi:SAM-dependent methyltransferase